MRRRQRQRTSITGRRYETFQAMFAQLLPALNKRRMLAGLKPILARNWRWHSLRHACAMNMHEMEDAPTELQIAIWCRMSLWILQYY